MPVILRLFEWLTVMIELQKADIKKCSDEKSVQKFLWEFLVQMREYGPVLVQEGM
jgi:hypothetical protein